jgi:hypothetical protein
LSGPAEDYFPEELQAIYVARQKSQCPFGDKPLVVMLRKTDDSPPPGMSADVWKRLNEEKREQKIGLTKLADGGGVGICLPCRDHDCLSLREFFVLATGAEELVTARL